MSSKKPESRRVPAVRGRRSVSGDPQFEIDFAEKLRGEHSVEALEELYSRFMSRRSAFDKRMRRILWRSLASACGSGLEIGEGVGFRHLETFEIGTGVFIGSQAYLQGRFDGRCRIGDHVWIGPHSFLDARDLALGDHVGWGPGAKVLGSEHTGLPVEIPIIQTDLEIRPVRVGDWADIGTNAVILPGVTIGKGSIVGAGAVVTEDVPDFAIVAGVPAKFLRWRENDAES